MNLEKQFDKIRSNSDYVDIAKMARLEDELAEARSEAGIAEKRRPLLVFIDRLLEKDRTREVNKKTYLILLFSCGWFTGAHRFYSGRKITGVLYLLFFWTGIPFTMCLFDFMGIIPREADDNGLVLI